ncbi:alpha/beta hydrolase, partial [Synechococcus sp. W55.2]
MEDLAQFAHNGTVSRQLDFYLRRLTPEQQAALADLLTRDFDPSTSAHYFDSRRKLPDPDCFAVQGGLSVALQLASQP